MTNSFGLDINNPGNSQYSRGAVSVTQTYFVGIVEDIIINQKDGIVLKYDKVDGKNIGEAKVRLIPEDVEKDIPSLKSAYPLDTNIQEYPYVGERVIVFAGGGKNFFYTRKLPIKNKITENISELDRDNVTARNTSLESDTRQLAIGGVSTNDTTTLVDTTNIPKPKLNINTRPLRSAPGDFILQSKFGGTIRMGSTLLNDESIVSPEPNIILTSGFWQTPEYLTTRNITDYSLTQENINEDASSIWMVANQEVPFQAITSLKKSVAHFSPTPTYTGAQIFISSNRIVLNSKLNEISLFSNKQISLSSLDDISMNTEKNISLNSFNNINIVSKESVFIQGADVSIMCASLTQKVTGDYGISGKRIFIGKYGDATQPMVLGTQLAAFLTTLITNVALLNAAVTGISAVLKTLPSGVGPAATPLLASNVDPNLVVISTQLAALISGTNPLGAVFNSQDNFVSKVNK